VFDKFFKNQKLTVTTCDCHGRLFQLDAELPNGQPVRVMESFQGWHLAIGEIPATPPPAISEEELNERIEAALISKVTKGG
jgi:hypothetical protein